MSTFGAPTDSGMRPDEPLAIVQNDNFEFYKTVFLGESMGSNVPLGRNLNPKTLYLAFRWKYDVTPRKRLKDCKITVTNALPGAKAEAMGVVGVHTSEQAGSLTCLLGWPIRLVSKRTMTVS
jgi:hypothetical protein